MGRGEQGRGKERARLCLPDKAPSLSGENLLHQCAIPHSLQCRVFGSRRFSPWQCLRITSFSAWGVHMQLLFLLQNPRIGNCTGLPKGGGEKGSGKPHPFPPPRSCQLLLRSVGLPCQLAGTAPCPGLGRAEQRHAPSMCTRVLLSTNPQTPLGGPYCPPPLWNPQR